MRFTRIVAFLIVLVASTAVAVPLASAIGTITQDSPFSGTTDVAGSSAFTDNLSTPGFTGVTYDTVTTNPNLTVSPSGAVTTVGGPLSAASYTVSGTDSDTGGDTDGTWSYTLNVTNTIVQGLPMSGTTDVAGSATFMDTLSPAAGYPGPITYQAGGQSSPPGLVVSTSGVISTSSTTLAAGNYTLSGVDNDDMTYGDAGSWTYELTVTPDTIVQGSPTSGSTTTIKSASFSDTLTASSGFDGSVTFLTSTPGFTISNGDELESTGALSVSGSPYAITGTDSDSFGDAGTWSYSLAVQPSGGTTTIVQSSPTTGTVTSTMSGSYTSTITVEGNAGPVTFVTKNSSPFLSVNSSGLISTAGPLTVGAYTVSGTDSDSHGDSGTWTYSLTVSAVVVTVTFEANGGSGVMAPQSESAPTALTLDSFKWSAHTFVDWNTAANGSGVSYANGDLFPFSTATVLFAQWASGKAPSHTVVFNANGGSGAMVSETQDTPTAISANRFARRGYTFDGWNTAANGTGESFQSGTTYPFKHSITLYAQWKKIPKKKPPVRNVKYVANGGTGAMAPERHVGPEALTPNHFVRAGYTFVDWNNAANGSGAAYANRAVYSFSASTTLYAQWKKVTIAPPPSNPNGINIGPFNLTVSALSASLESRIRSLAYEVKTKGGVEITLTGYGDSLPATDLHNTTDLAVNLELGRMRAQAVATYLEGRLGALSLTGWTISLGASGAGTSALDGYVTATLTDS